MFNEFVLSKNFSSESWHYLEEEFYISVFAMVYTSEL